MKKIDVSVIVPVYNVEKWVGRCLDSLLSQTKDNYEIIVVNDGSTDDSLNICRKYESKYTKIKVFSKLNGGLSDARNFGLNYASGNYVMFVDSDDFVEENYIEKMFTIISKKKALMAICGFYLTDEKGKKLDLFPQSRTLNFSNDKVEISGKELLYYLYNESGWVDVPAWNKIFDRKIFEKYKFKKGVYFEDSALIHKLVWNISQIMVIHEPLYNYVQRQNSIINSPVNLKKIKDRNAYNVDRINFFKNRDSRLYYLSTVTYRRWILRMYVNNPALINDKKLTDYFNDQFRKLHSVSDKVVKEQIKQILCIFSLRKTVSLITLTKKLKNKIKRKKNRLHEKKIIRY